MNSNELEPGDRPYLVLSRLAIFLYILPMLLVAYKVLSLPLWALYLMPLPYFLVTGYCYLRLSTVGRLHIRPLSLVLTLLMHGAICYYIFGR
jgi:glucan phosphoethanolaminetransferase (alkaline phosphatase superfamily)